MFVHRGHTGEGAIITVSPGKVFGLYAGDYKFEPAMESPFFFFLVKVRVTWLYAGDFKFEPVMGSPFFVLS